MDDIMKIVNSHQGSGLLINVDSKTIKNEAKEQKGGLVNMFLGTLDASLLGNLLTIKEIKAKKLMREVLTLFMMEGSKTPLTSLPLVTSTNVGISPQKFLNFSFKSVSTIV